ncbi:hypothetical protein SBRCBS47491_009823 [Sporothrix bragantina]|uniref:HNH domain-containing protein n=1 Tax=Sporothrix bragantina TaxID=671064 RepID=A0ABP0D0F2_9PEZI
MDSGAEPASGVVDVDITDTNYAIYREALAAVLIDKLAEPEAKPKKRQRKKRGKKAAAKTDEKTAPQADLDDWEVVDAEPQDAGDENGDKNDNKNDNNNKEGGNDGGSPTKDNPADDANDLAEFVDYLARETFDLLPEDLRTLAHHAWVADAALRSKYGEAEDGSTSGGVPVPGPLNAARVTEVLPGLEPSPVADSMQAYGVVDENKTAAEIVAPALSSYLVAAAAAPPPPRSTRDQADGCEICGRDWLPLSYHHLIPRFVHAKVVKRGWHRADELQNVAWLCGACHRRVHRFANHEDLARYYYTVERLLAEPEMQRYAAWASRLRWKGK